MPHSYKAFMKQTLVAINCSFSFTIDLKCYIFVVNIWSNLWKICGSTRDWIVSLRQLTDKVIMGKTTIDLEKNYPERKFREFKKNLKSQEGKVNKDNFSSPYYNNNIRKESPRTNRNLALNNTSFK